MRQQTQDQYLERMDVEDSLWWEVSELIRWHEVLFVEVVVRYMGLSEHECPERPALTR